MQPTTLEINWLKPTSENRETPAKAGVGSWNLFLVEPKDTRKTTGSGRMGRKYEVLEMQRLIDLAG